MNLRLARNSVCVALALQTLAGFQTAQAEEGGSGHYFPGSLASFMDGVSPVPTLIARTNIIDYNAGISASRSLPIAGLTALNVDVESKVFSFTGFWAPRWGKINDRWNYAMSATVPLVDMTISADVEAGMPGVTLPRRDSDSGLGDILLMPVMLNYAANPELNINFRVTLIAPTGDYEAGRLANTGKNFWTIEPAIGVMYMGQKSGFEASVFFGVDFNTKNDDTNYKSGTQAHLDATVAQHFPLWGGLGSAGATAYWYQQVEGDSGGGATFGDFKARAHGIGPTVSWVKPLGKGQLLTELKWISEFGTRNRPEGDIVFLKAMYKFY